MPRRVDLLRKIVRRKRWAIARTALLFVLLFVGSLAIPAQVRKLTRAGLGISRPGFFVALADGGTIVVGRADGTYHVKPFLNGFPFGMIRHRRIHAAYVSLGFIPCAFPVLGLFYIGRKVPGLHHAIDVLNRAKAKLICPTCAYDLTGLPRDARCPECGTTRGRSADA